MPTLYTIGHSNHLFDKYLALLKTHGITTLIDLRAVPKSRFRPWFNQKALQAALEAAGIKYIPLPELGGRREHIPNSINTAIKPGPFRGFADYMQTEAFYLALKKLNTYLKKSKKVAMMCAEAKPENCHRSLISDAELARGVKVLHILGNGDLQEHELSTTAKVDKRKKPVEVYYPHKQQSLLK